MKQIFLKIRVALVVLGTPMPIVVSLMYVKISLLRVKIEPL